MSIEKPMLRCGIIPTLLKDNSIVLRGVFPNQIKKYKIKGSKNIFQLLLILQEGGKTIDEILLKASENSQEINKSLLNQLIEVLTSKNLIVESLETNFQSERYNRQLLFFSAYENEVYSKYEIQNNISNSQVAIIGAGGTGTWIALTLAAAGIKRLTLIDFDKVEFSNLNRQILYTPQDVGQYKVDVAKKRLEEFRPDIQIDAYNIKIRDKSDLDKISFDNVNILLGVGSPPNHTAELISEYCISRSIPYLISNDSLIGPLYIPGKSPCYECMKLHLKKLNKEYEEQSVFQGTMKLETIHPSFAPFVAFGAIVAAEQVLRFLGNYMDTEVTKGAIGVNFATYRTNLFEFSVHHECKYCSIIQMKEKNNV